MRLQTQVKATPTPSFSPVRSGTLQRKASSSMHSLDGNCIESQTLNLQYRTANQTELATVPSIVHEVLGSQGQPLDPATCALMESRFGHDFSQVRVHTDAKAAESALLVNALAYTVGKDLVFGTGHYTPETPTCRQLVAHELTHVVQQRATHAEHIIHTTSKSDPAEQEAMSVGRAFTSGHQIPAISARLSPSTIAQYRTPRPSWFRAGTTWSIEYDDDIGIHLLRGHLFSDTRRPWHQVYPFSAEDLTGVLGLPTGCLIEPDESSREVTQESGGEFDGDSHYVISYDFEWGMIDRPDVQERLVELGLLSSISDMGLEQAERPRSEESIAQLVEGEIGVATEQHRLWATVRLAPRQTLISDDLYSIVTGEGGTSIEVSVSGQKLYISFNPPLNISIISLIPDIWLRRLSWDFTTQRLRTYYRPRIAHWLQIIETRIQEELIRILPQRMRSRGYNPFIDTALLNDLPRIASRLTSGSSPEQRLPRTTNVNVSTAVTLTEDLRYPREGIMHMFIPQGTEIVVSAQLGGTRYSLGPPTGHSPHTGYHPFGTLYPVLIGGVLPESLRDLHIESITLRFEGQYAQARAGDLTLAVIEETTFPYSGPLNARYSFTIFPHRRGQQLPLRENELTEMIEQDLVPLIVQYRSSIPGIDLANILGIPHE